ncbi:MAG: flagellar hook-basal body complex protein [Pseudomonadota bacterium]
MDNAGYVAMTRSSGLFKQLSVIANNLANISTSGYRREGASFAEHVKSTGFETPSVSMTNMNRRFIDFSQGDIQKTDNALDVAINGPGFFLVETNNGERLTRAGAFTLNPDGELTTAEGYRVLDEGGGAIALPPGASSIIITEDGTISADGQAISRLGVVDANQEALTRQGDNLFSSENGYEQLEAPRVLQGAVEGSNVNPIEEIALLIEVQRAYEAGQNLSKAEDERIRQTVRQLGRDG